MNKKITSVKVSIAPGGYKAEIVGMPEITGTGSTPDQARDEARKALDRHYMDASAAEATPQPERRPRAPRKPRKDKSE